MAAVSQRRFAKLMRHPGHDYRAPCSVHVTICASNYQPLFGAMAPTGVRLRAPFKTRDGMVHREA
jgi:hypothetical protein